MATVVKGVWRGKVRHQVRKKSRRAYTSPESPRRTAVRYRTSEGQWRHPTREQLSLRGQKRRRKGGPRRKVSILRTITRWIPVRMKVRISRRRR